MKKRFASILLSAVGALLMGSSLAQAAEPVALRVLVVQPTDLKAYVQELQVAQGIIKKAGLTTKVRAWQAQFAGAETGTVIVSLEFANLAELARYYELTRTNAELAAQLAKFATLRKIVSDSLYQELMP
jgi:hypothetical protein